MAANKNTCGFLVANKRHRVQLFNWTVILAWEKYLSEYLTQAQSF